MPQSPSLAKSKAKASPKDVKKMIDKFNKQFDSQLELDLPTEEIEKTNTNDSDMRRYSFLLGSDHNLLMGKQNLYEQFGNNIKVNETCQSPSQTPLVEEPTEANIITPAAMNASQPSQPS